MDSMARSSPREGDLFACMDGTRRLLTCTVWTTSSTVLEVDSLTSKSRQAMNHGEIKSYGTVPQEQHDQSSHTEEEFLLPAVNPAEHSFNCAQKISQCVGQQSAFGWTRPQALILVFLCGSVLLVSILVPFSSSGNATMSSSPPQPPSVPWPHVNRSSSAGNGVTSFLNLDLFHRSLLLESSTDDTTTERKFRFPFPTGA